MWYWICSKYETNNAGVKQIRSEIKDVKINVSLTEVSLDLINSVNTFVEDALGWGLD